ncbi:DUF2608 domain-containing protein [Legionella impletisoli]|uniref:Uncharacterized protein n=1 Tax=Legionella impletisoli TaxID=343510 RepID=A0A917JYG1_9GAMM|nr:DUF2608 domain-containing protein [Legionella impletisoli]GGI89032.1 hypothetical protein GCM10007966_17250 [Legionella impletisoli]
MDAAEQNTIFESHVIKDILKHVHYNSYVLFDLDNTVMQSQIELGSDQWFEYLLRHTLSQISDPNLAATMVFAIYNEIQKIVKTTVVEQSTIKLIQAFQDIGLPVIAITARGKCLHEPTVRQLKDCQIDFSYSKSIPHASFSFQIDTSSSAAEAFYADGIIFCSGKNKGQCLNAFWDRVNASPKNIIMTDDKKKSLVQVNEMAQSRGIRFVGSRYGFLDEKVSRFDANKALEQMGAICRYLPEEIQLLVTQLMNPPKISSRDYLRFFYTDNFQHSEKESQSNLVMEP